MDLNKEAQLLQNEIRKFAKDIIAEKADEFDKKGLFPLENIKKIAEMGILGATIPESYGGFTLDTVSLLVTLEEISKVCPSTALIIFVHNILFSYPIVRFGSEEQKKKYLGRLATGEIIGGYAEVLTNEISVMEDNDSYKISGRNHILLNGTANGPFIMFIESNNKTIPLIVDENLLGVKRSKKDNIIGMNASGINEVIFDKCSIPKSSRLGEDSKIVLEEIKGLANLGLSVINLGIAEASAESAVKYAKERVQFDQPIINFGMVREMIVDMITEIEGMRQLIYDAGMLRDNNKDFIRASAIARYFSNQAVAKITTNAIQVYGGYGYMKDYPVERYFRDAQVSRVLCTQGIELKELIIQKTI
jgi:alkylation response protein AidB-like acyl-CoA dehydrogenase